MNTDNWRKIIKSLYVLLKEDEQRRTVKITHKDNREKKQNGTTTLLPSPLNYYIFNNIPHTHK